MSTLAARYQSVILTFILGWMVFTSCASFAFERSGIGARVEQSCSVRGTGDGSCTFTNTGWSPGSLCVEVAVQRIADGQRMGAGLACSGRLEPSDSRAVPVSVLDGATSPVEFCGGSLAQPWTTLCHVVADPASR